ncbi:hypothetical protein ACDY96_24785 [Rhizobium mongolense]|uniref:hypothetical protein n=1 Tax=Rhizobium mongolense TaxID=57676 RepID=UPI003557F122
MGDSDDELCREYENCIALIVETRRGTKRWTKVDLATGQEIDITASQLSTLEDTARSIARALGEIDANTRLYLGPSKDWHFN